MEYKLLARTGLKLPEIGLGTWEFGGDSTILKEGIREGVFLIDTAESYGTEEIVGEAVREIRSQAFVATKVSPQNFRTADLLKAADRSLRRMKTDYIDLYQLHYPNYNVSLEETLGTMEELVDKGKVRFIGVSNFPLSLLKKAQRCLRKHPLVSNQVRYSLLDREAEHGLIDYCQQQQITILAYSPLARGLSNLHAKDRRGVLRKISAEAGKTEAQVALNWCLSKPAIIALVKAGSVAHVLENCGASGWRLSAEQVAELEQGIIHRSHLESAIRGAVRRTMLTLRYR